MLLIISKRTSKLLFSFAMENTLNKYKCAKFHINQQPEKVRPETEYFCDSEKKCCIS